MNAAILLKSHCSSWGFTGSKETVPETLAIKITAAGNSIAFEMHKSIRTSVNWKSTIIITT